jgi:subtilase family serine protease
VVVGENVSVAATVTNTGDVQATQTVSFAVDGGREGSEELTLAGGENATLTFTYRTSGQDTPEIGVAVASENETATATVAVLSGSTSQRSRTRWWSGRTRRWRRG